MLTARIPFLRARQWAASTYVIFRELAVAASHKPKQNHLLAALPAAAYQRLRIWNS
jgi:hypothetical protein